MDQPSLAKESASGKAKSLPSSAPDFQPQPKINTMNNDQVSHLWAAQSRPSASGSNFFFEGDTIYSYGRHFPIARHYKGIVLITTGSRSGTTSCHTGLVRRAVCHLTQFHVADPTKNPSGSDVKAYGEMIKSLELTAGRARNPESALSALESHIMEANAFCQQFGFKTRFSMPDVSALKEKAKLATERQRKAVAARQARIDKENAEKLANWMAGDLGVRVPYEVSGVRLRAVGDLMETSKGATIPLSEAQRAFRFASLKRSAGWHRNGETFPVGDFHLDAINEQGVVAGCHRIAWDEITRFAKAQSWI